MKMKYLYLFSLLLIVASSCSTQNNATESVSLSREDVSLAKDSIEYYETEFEVRQKNYRDLLKGTWVIDTMRRQARLNAEALTNVFITFGDSTFNGRAGCNHVSGSYTLKGTSIKFSDIITTKMSCENIEQEIAFLDLLNNTVSAYTVSSNSLLLRDGASNIVFTAIRK